MKGICFKKIKKKNCNRGENSSCIAYSTNGSFLSVATKGGKIFIYNVDSRD